MDLLTTVLLLMILLSILIAPLCVHIVAQQLEIFFLGMGILAVSATGMWSTSLALDAAQEPVMISAAVLLFGLLFHTVRSPLRRQVTHLLHAMGAHLFFFLVVAGLGLLSSIITAIIASLVLVEIVRGLTLDRRAEVQLVVLCCCAIGLGAALTPIGEPLSTIVIAKLRGAPHHAGFFYVWRLLGPWIVASIIGLAAVASFITARHVIIHASLTEVWPDAPQNILWRTGRMYVFIVALVLLGAGFQPAIEHYVLPLPPAGLYWMNTLSAVLDNATLAAAEFSPRMREDQIISALIALMASGGMLIPGNIPNIIAAHSLNISSWEWARYGLRIGGGLLVTYYVLLFIV